MIQNTSDSLRILKCSQCKHEKPSTEFNRDKKKATGRDSACKECTRAYERRPEVKKRRQEAAKERRKRPGFIEERASRYLRQRYGFDLDAKRRMLIEQGNCCAICKSPDSLNVRGWHVDHDHKTGRTRGLLCLWCNAGVGNFRDNPLFHLNAAVYLCSGVVN